HAAVGHEFNLGSPKQLQEVSPRRTRSAGDGSASQAPVPGPEATRRGADAPWHDPKPAFDDPQAAPPDAEAEPDTKPAADPRPQTDPTPDNGGDA
ncbi:hypothetical protein ABZZ19_06855, partial [Streptomyces sp. NPDC006341]